MVKVLRSLVRGPLESYAPGFSEELLRQGYARSSASQQLCLVAHLDRWMLAEGVGIGDLGGPVIERYLAARRAGGYVQYLSGKAMRPLLDYLEPLGVLPPVPVVRTDPMEESLGRYRVYLLVERGLTAGTARGYVDAVRPFVAGRVRGAQLDWTGLSAVDVSEFVLAACPGRATGTAKLIVCSLRSMLGWLHVSGQISSSLVESPRV